MIIATDGVWEFLSSQDAVDIVAKGLQNGDGSSMACQHLIEAAAAKWHEREGDYRDDITALVIQMKELWAKH
jgi:serine/threonine protein phosphatase PrpC